MIRPQKVDGKYGVIYRILRVEATLLLPFQVMVLKMPKFVLRSANFLLFLYNLIFYKFGQFFPEHYWPIFFVHSSRSNRYKYLVLFSKTTKIRFHGVPLSTPFWSAKITKKRSSLENLLLYPLFSEKYRVSQKYQSFLQI